MLLQDNPKYSGIVCIFNSRYCVHLAKLISDTPRHALKRGCLRGRLRELQGRGSNADGRSIDAASGQSQG
jgi:hypothetical protein